MDELETPTRRRNPVRAAVAALGIAAVVAAVTTAAVVIAHDDSSPDPQRKSQDAGARGEPVAPTPAPPSGNSDPVNPDCGHGAGLIDIFTTKPPPIAPDSLAQQQALIDRITSRTWSGFDVVGAEPTHLGVAAVVDRNYDGARRALAAEGVHLVAVQMAEVTNVHRRAMDAVQDRLEAAIHDFNRQRQGVSGFEALAAWEDAGAVVVNWKAPIPAEIKAQGGVRDDGVNVIIQPVQYSLAELQAAQSRMFQAIDHHEVDARWTEASGCQDGSGLAVGVAPDSLGSRQEELESQLTSAAGVPVHVYAQEAPQPLALRGPARRR